MCQTVAPVTCAARYRFAAPPKRGDVVQVAEWPSETEVGRIFTVGRLVPRQVRNELIQVSIVIGRSAVNRKHEHCVPVFIDGIDHTPAIQAKPPHFYALRKTLCFFDPGQIKLAALRRTWLCR